jgi:hypothetical protein
MRIFSFVILDLHGSDSKALIPDGIKKSNTKKPCPFFLRHLKESGDTRVQGQKENTCATVRKTTRKKISKPAGGLIWGAEIFTGRILRIEPVSHPR